MTNIQSFLTGFALATGLNSIEADANWAAYTRQLGDREREEIEAGGHDAGLAMGIEYLAAAFATAE